MTFKVAGLAAPGYEGHSTEVWSPTYLVLSLNGFCNELHIRHWGGIIHEQHKNDAAERWPIMQCFYIRAYYEPLLVRNYSGAILRSCDMYTHICHPQKLAWCFAGVCNNFPCRRRHIQISDCRWITWDSWSPSTGNVHPAWTTTLLLCRWTPSIGIQGGHWCLKS